MNDRATVVATTTFNDEGLLDFEFVDTERQRQYPAVLVARKLLGRELALQDTLSLSRFAPNELFTLQFQDLRGHFGSA
jgi:hypothetical protein